ncbi:MAG: elongation factor G [Spirochaetales bacterium]|nr:elongation factor G [Spirochaetales bacterium]
MSFDTDAIRNIAIVGHGSTGKTTLFENMLFAGGTISRPETVASGKTVSDYTDEEIERKTSVHLALGYIETQGRLINIMDTPGASDFVGEVAAAFRITESAVVIMGAKEGVQIETLKLWRRLNTRNKPRMVFVNKLDGERADFEQPLADMRQKFATHTFVPVSIPIAGSEGYKGVVDLIAEKAYLVPDSGVEKAVDVPDDMKDDVATYRSALIEAAAEGDDALMEKYFEQETLAEDEIRKGLAAAFAANKFVPVFCGAAESANGILPLLNFICAAAPSPAVTIEKAQGNDGNETDVHIGNEGHPSCLCFKTSIDQFSGKMSYVRVVTGTLVPDSDLYNSVKMTKQRLGKLYRIVGKKLVETTSLAAGDVGILTKLDSVTTGDTLCTQDAVIKYKPIAVPQPVHSLAVSAVNKKDEDKMNHWLQRAAEEDSTFTISYNGETKQTVISGMGELHINMILDRIKEQQKIEIETKVPRVPYRETITKPSDSEYTHKKQTGGHGQYGRVVLEIEPLQSGEHYKFENGIRGQAVSKGYMPGIEKGIVEGMEAGILAGYPVVGIGARIVDGKEHPVDSSEMAFKLAAKGALMAAMEKAKPVLLEPVVNLRVFTNDEYVGDILSDLSSRRGRVLGQESVGGGITQIDAQVPQAELLRYSIDLRSITSGTASFEMEFSHYSPISGKIADDVIAASKAAKNDE